MLNDYVNIELVGLDFVFMCVCVYVYVYNYSIKHLTTWWLISLSA